MIRGISDRATFGRLFAEGQHVRSAHLRCRYVVGTSGENPRVAYSISKKVGSAVVRNRLRRRLRSAVTEYCGQHNTSLSAMVLIVNPGAVDLRYNALQQQVIEIMEKID